jgi:diguanylate cyclase (GGDEF)-like protein
MVLPNCKPAFGHIVAESMRQRIEQYPIPLEGGKSVSITVSIGGAFAPQWVRTSMAAWLDRADRQLYRAKAEGRNRVCLETMVISDVSAEEKGLLFTPSQIQELEENKEARRNE